MGEPITTLSAALGNPKPSCSPLPHSRLTGAVAPGQNKVRDGPRNGLIIRLEILQRVLSGIHNRLENISHIIIWVSLAQGATATDLRDGYHGPARLYTFEEKGIERLTPRHGITSLEFLTRCWQYRIDIFARPSSVSGVIPKSLLRKTDFHILNALLIQELFVQLPLSPEPLFWTLCFCPTTVK